MKTIPQQETEAAGQQPNSFVSQKKRLILSRLSSSSIVTRVAADQDESRSESSLGVRASRLAAERALNLLISAKVPALAAATAHSSVWAWGSRGR
jgi:hypothetical protein